MGSNGKPLSSHLDAICKQATEDIKNCGNACDTYFKRSVIVRVLTSHFDKDPLSDFVAIFTERRHEFQLAIAMHTAISVRKVGRDVSEMKNT